MRHVKSEVHEVHKKTYELLVYQVKETEEYRIYISESGIGIGDVYTATDEVVRDAKSTGAGDIVEQLITIAKNDIERNEFQQY